MSKYDKYVFLPSFSLEPNKVTSYNSVFIKDFTTNTLKSIHEFKTRKVIRKNNGVQSTDIKTKSDINICQLNRSTHNFNISDNAYRTLKRRINWLYYLAKSKSVKTYNGKSIYNFKMGFITLTLPGKQRTCTADVTKLLLNNFLTEIRHRTKMENYVWRLEFQKNGNVHYHIVTDTYVDYFLIQKVWNRILKLNGYIESYQQKFKDLSLTQYRNLVDKEQKTEFNVISKRYAKGKQTNWENPPSVDVKSVISNKAISNYISKYFGKDNDENPIKNEHDNDENSSNLRLWFCSRSLSKLKSVSNFCGAIEYDIFAVVSWFKEQKTIIGKYATVIYFEIKSCIGGPRIFIEKLLKDYAKKQGYIPAL